eukprot:m.21296 g.21296  ORF g.21296 m.21296 type:complete len:362 (-) comp5676_c0_seq1:85-1170(-)
MATPTKDKMNMNSAYSAQPGLQLDPLAMSKFANTKNYSIKQGNIWGEAISCGCCANRYMVSDNDRPTKVLGREEKHDFMVPTPLFLMEEESDLCCRVCCNGNQPINVRYYHANHQVTAGQTQCGCCYSGHVYTKDPAYPTPVMTLERPGCCDKWLCGACCICSDKCQSEGYMHIGEPTPGKIGERYRASQARIFSSQKVPPAGGGGCTPTLNVYSGMPEPQGKNTSDNFVGVIEGPCIFGGCLQLCTDTIYPISTKPGKSGDIGLFKKVRPDSCFKLICQSTTDVDEYSLTVNPSLDPMQKANLLGAAVHTDYLYFEADVPPCMVVGDSQNGVIIITLFSCYFRGCIMPFFCCIPYGNNGG